MWKRPHGALLLMSATSLGAACGGSAEDVAEDGSVAASDRICSPGSTQRCVGPGACEGAQACNREGSAWLACLCGGNGSAGAATGDVGADSGGASNGGAETGGANTGGASNGGASNGGLETGGANTGGTSDEVCTTVPVCAPDGDCEIALDAVYRDFDTNELDFPAPDTGVVEDVVGATLVNGKPFASTGALDAAATNVASWYADDHPSAATLRTSLKLFHGAGTYAMRLTDDGQRFVAPNNDIVLTECIDGQVGGTGAPCVPCLFYPLYSCTPGEHDGNMVFFPVDGLGAERARAKVSPPTTELTSGWSWPWEDNWAYWPEGWDASVQHNFYFSSEISLVLRYDPLAPVTIDVRGDDDVWLFVNGTLAVDLGGTHVPVAGTVTVGPTNAFGLQDGDTYTVKLFHAERRQEGSSLNISLTGLTPGTNCAPR